MQQAIINDELMGEEQLYYFENDINWYYCKYFSFREEYCYIDTDRTIKQSCCFQEKSILPDYYYCNCTFDISFKTIKGEKYAILEFPNVIYKIPFKYYNNIIEALYCDIYAYDNSNNLNYSNFQNKPLIFMDNDEIIGWIEPCAFEAYRVCEYIEEDVKGIPQDIIDNFIFKDVSPFKNGISRVEFDDFCAKLDTDGNIIQKYECDNCWFYGKYTTIQISGKWGVIDSDNNFIIPPKYENIDYIQDDMWRVTLNNKQGIIDSNDSILVNIIYDELTNYKNTSYLIAVKNNLWGIIDKSENIIIPFEYSQLWYGYIGNEIKDSNIYAMKNGFAGIISIKGDIVIPFEYKELFYLSENTISAKIDNEKYILINENNERICPTIFEDMHENFDKTDIYPVKLNGLWGFIDELGNTKIDFKYEDVSRFSDGYCEVAIKGQELIFNNFGLIDKLGNLILNYDYLINCTFMIDDERFVVEKEHYKPFIVDKNNKIIKNEIYDRILPYSNSTYFPARFSENIWGFVNRNGEPLKINKESFNIPITTINFDGIDKRIL